MPLPPARDYTEKELDSEMKKLGWRKRLTVKWVEYNALKGEWEQVTYYFNVARAPCTNKECKEYDLTYYIFMPHGVYWSCAACRRGMGPISNEEARVADRETITVLKALEIIKETGQAIPVGLSASRVKHKITKG